jgi:hypothetical protein
VTFISPLHRAGRELFAVNWGLHCFPVVGPLPTSLERSRAEQIARDDWPNLDPSAQHYWCELAKQIVEAAA